MPTISAKSAESFMGLVRPDPLPDMIKFEKFEKLKTREMSIQSIQLRVRMELRNCWRGRGVYSCEKVGGRESKFVRGKVRVR